MIIKEIRAYIMCSECGSGFEYSALSVHTRLEDVYSSYLQYYLNDCVQCHKGTLIVRDVECRSLPSKALYEIRWQCNVCGSTWVQTEYISKEELGSGGLLKRFKSTLECPNSKCMSRNKRLLGMHRK